MRRRKEETVIIACLCVGVYKDCKYIQRSRAGPDLTGPVQSAHDGAIHTMNFLRSRNGGPSSKI